MTFHYNKVSERTNRRKLRQDSTKAEEILWKYLRNRKLLDIKFKRQYSVDQFVFDFYSPQMKFAIELDGKVHLDEEVKNHDENRDGYLESFGIKILRIKNEMVINDIENTLKLINENIIIIKNKLE